MGMDVSGRKPTTEAGAYFRNNVWWWRPLAEYITGNAPLDITHKCQYWQSNDGDGLGGVDSRRLAAWLREELAEGRTATYGMERQARLDAIPRETCNYCEGTGVRRDAIGLEHGFDKKVCDIEAGPREGQAGWCNACHGWGTVANFDTHYPFSVENVTEFATFLEGSGGFRIHGNMVGKWEVTETPAEQTEKPWKPWQNRPPRYAHDCKVCEYLGPYNEYDLYYHGLNFPTVLARYGSAGSEYHSGLGMKGMEELQEAERRAIVCNLMTLNGTPIV